jgi:hypothetical protein
LSPEANEVSFYLYATENCSITIHFSTSEQTLELRERAWEWYTISSPKSRRVTEVYFTTPFGKLSGWAEIVQVLLGGISFCSEGDLLSRIEGEAVTVSWTNATFEHYRGLPFEHPNFSRIDPDDPDSWRKNSDYNLYFGDIHIHTNRSICCYPFNKSEEENYRTARDKWELDFACLTDHEYQTEEQWKESIALANEYNTPGEFATLIGVEWTSLDYGHKNVYFRDADAPQVSRYDPRTDTPPRLYDYLKKLGKEVIVIPHHPAFARHLTNWHYHDPELEPLVELISNWGNCECYNAILQATEKTVPGCYVQDALARGYHLGFIGSSDGHHLMGGDSPIAAVYAPELSREAVFDALKARRAYATSGAKIKLNFAINNFFMGSIITVNQYTIDALFPLKIMVAAEGTAAIDRVEVVANGAVIYTYKQHMGRFTRTAFSINVENTGHNLAQTSRYYYVRVIQTDGHAAWSSPIWIDFQMNDRQDIGVR